MNFETDTSPDDQAAGMDGPLAPSAKRQLKDLLYEQVARMGRALASPKRLELLELLAQGEKSVEQLAQELSIDIKLASAHLKALREARLVAARKLGKFVVYRLAGDDVAALWVSLRQVAQAHLVELRVALDGMVSDPLQVLSLNRHALMASAEAGEIVLIDVRPRTEFDQAHLPFARSMPLPEIARRLDELPRDREIVAYCRGPFCLFSDEALHILNAQGFQVRKLLDGVGEWQAAGLPLAA